MSTTCTPQNVGSLAERGRRVAVIAATPVVPLGLDEEVAERGVGTVRVGWREHDLAVAGELDLPHLVAVVGDRDPPHLGRPSGTTAISVRVSMSPSARWMVTRSVAR